MHLRPKCVPCLLSPTICISFSWFDLSLSLSLSFFSSLHKSFSHPLSLRLILVLHNFFLSFDRCQCDSIWSQLYDSHVMVRDLFMRFVCIGTYDWPVCWTQRNIYRPTRTMSLIWAPLWMVKRHETPLDPRGRCCSVFVLQELRASNCLKWFSDCKSVIHNNRRKVSTKIKILVMKIVF